jgi:transcriptional regulator with XRE-family HTH domain
MRFTEIGQQLRAYRLESGMRAEEIAARLGVSRAALYRYEKGDVIKLDTITRLAELLKISPLSLLGIGVEYYSRPIGYFERVRQLEETADQLLLVQGPVNYLTTSDTYDAAVAETLDETRSQTGSDRGTGRAMLEQVLGIQAARKRMYQQRRPGIIAIVAIEQIKIFLDQGVCGHLRLSDQRRKLCREVAAAEIELMADTMEAEPIGIQIGLLANDSPPGGFGVIRARDRANLIANPFRPDIHPTSEAGVAMITSADQAVAAHQRAAENCWREALKGAAASQRVREVLVGRRV